MAVLRAETMRHGSGDDGDVIPYPTAATKCNVYRADGKACRSPIQTSVESKAMFSGLTAWFSSSTSNRKIQTWLDNGGREASLDDAEYIFSANAECDDTKRIFTSEAYLDEHLAVFHPNYINECLKRGGPNSEVLGRYFFPPKDVQKLIRAQMSLHWDDDGHTSDGDTVNAAKKQSQPMPGPSNTSTKPPQTSQATTATRNKSPLKAGSRTMVQQQEEQEYQRLEDLAKSTGELTDFVPGRDGGEMVIR